MVWWKVANFIFNITKEGNTMEEKPVYEKLAPFEVLIISRKGDCLIYAVNEGGKIVIRKAYIEELDEGCHKT